MNKPYVYKPIDIASCKSSYRALRFSFAGLIAAPVLFIVLAIAQPSVSGGVLVALWLITAISGLLYYVFLGVLASKNHRNVFAWVFLTLVTSPIGFIAGFLMMRNVGIRNGWI